MPFDSVTFRNIQKHKKITVELDPLVTTLVGPSQAGKTALIRGLGLICLNRWDKAYLRHGKSFLSAELKVDGHTIKRKKGKGVNQYLINGKILKRDLTGKKVPEEIANLLNVGEENFQFQLDPHFWFQESPGQVAKNLNQIVNLSIIDSTLANAAAEVRSAKAEVEISHNRYLLAREERKELAWVPEFAAELDELVGLQTETSAKSNRIAFLTFCVQNVRKCDSTIQLASNASLDAKKLADYAKKSLVSCKRRKTLEKLLKEVRKVALLVKQGAPDISDVDRLRKKGDATAEHRRELDMLIDELTTSQERICNLEKALKEQTKKLSKIKRCPICGGKVSSAPTFTSGTSHQCQERKKVKNGIGVWPDI